MSNVWQYDLIEMELTRGFHIKCQDHFYGGFAKYPGTHSDVLHAFYSVSGGARGRTPWACMA